MISNIYFVVRLMISAACGSAIGYERTNRNKVAGIRTHAIVALASALMMIISKYGFYDVDNYDAARIAAQIVSGVGFLGAGLIFVRNKTTVSGLTTAAGLWGTAGVGMAIGAGQHFIGIFATILMVLIQIYFHQNNFFTKKEGYRYKLFLTLKSMKAYSEIKGIITEDAQIECLSIKKKNNGIIDLEIDLIMKESYNKFSVLEEIMKNDDVVDCYWE